MQEENNSLHARHRELLLENDRLTNQATELSAALEKAKEAATNLAATRHKHTQDVERRLQEAQQAMVSQHAYRPRV